MSHPTKSPFDSVECSTPHDLLIRCSLSNLQFPAIALTWCGLTSHRHRSIEPFFMSLAARDSEFRRWSGGVDRRIRQTFAASPAEPGELPLGFRPATQVGRRSTRICECRYKDPPAPLRSAFDAQSAAQEDAARPRFKVGEFGCVMGGPHLRREGGPKETL